MAMPRRRAFAFEADRTNPYRLQHAQRAQKTRVKGIQLRLIWPGTSIMPPPPRQSAAIA
jgi:hypothetical protein